jgi:hypothetical protein
MKTRPPLREPRDLPTLILRLEELKNQIDCCQEEITGMLDALKCECDQLISDVKEQLHRSFVIGEEHGFDSIPDVPIKDRRLKRAWIALYRHHNGVTADVIASETGRHRTTVSTSLNTLVLMHWAEKERRGHQILYKAVMKTDQDVPE